MDTWHCHANHQSKRSRVDSALGNGTVLGGLTRVGLPQETVPRAGAVSIPAGSITSAPRFDRTARPAVDGLVSGGVMHVGLLTETFHLADYFGQVGGLIPFEMASCNEEIASSTCFANRSFPSFN